MARQPIFNRFKEVYGYEILYRNGKNADFSESDGEYASGSVLTRCFLDFGVNELTGNKKAFINFTGQLLNSDIATIFPRKYLVIEILETVNISEEILKNCKKLKELGYTLAIDDFEYRQGYEELLKLVDIVKVDFIKSNREERQSIVQKFKRKGLVFLAEKVETQEDYRQALNLGFQYFQGYYFSKPEITSRQKIIPFPKHTLDLIQMLNEPQPDFLKISSLIEKDLSFSYDILKLVNSVYYGYKTKITSIRHAVSALGITELKKWVYLSALRDVKADKPEELVRICMIRGQFMANMALKSRKQEIAFQLLTIGMFSLIDLLTGKEMEKVLDELNFMENIKLVLLNRQNDSFQGICYNIALCYEQGLWNEVEKSAVKASLSTGQLNESYVSAVKEVERLYT